MENELRRLDRNLQLIPTLEDCHATFQNLLEREANDAEFALNLLDQQIKDAREHLAAGRMDKVAAEIADCFSVGWQALYWLGFDPEPTIVQRIRTRIIPRAAELAERDRAGNGYKPKPGSEASFDFTPYRRCDRCGAPLCRDCGDHLAAAVTGHPEEDFCIKCEVGGTNPTCEQYIRAGATPPKKVA